MKLPDSSWSVKVETAPDSRGSVLVASWEGERLSCRPLVMLSVLSSREEMMSLPVSGLSGRLSLPVLPSCQLLRVRLASLVTGNNYHSRTVTGEISYKQARTKFKITEMTRSDQYKKKVIPIPCHRVKNILYFRISLIFQVNGLDYLKSHLYIIGLTTMISFCVEPTLSIPR